jgi:hypothetical protein
VKACIAEPVSWLRLERYARDPSDAAIRDHLATCPACAACLDEIRTDVVALPPLAVPVRAARRRWWFTLVPALAAAAAILLVLLRRPSAVDEANTGEVAIRVPGVKGGPDVIVNLVRERAGTIRTDVRTYAPGDRWKVVVTCPPDLGTWLDVAVVDGATVDYPLAPAHVACGNQVVVPGAFSITGDRPNQICVRIAPDTPPDRGSPGTACVTLRNE